MGKANRHRYSRWDGTQVGFDLDATDIFSEITDDLLYHGDLNAALRRMMQSGFQDANGERMQGLREMLEKLRGSAARRSRTTTSAASTTRSPVSCATSSSRSGTPSTSWLRRPVTPATPAARSSPRRSPPSATPPSTCCSPDLANMVRELQQYDFTSSEARQHFEELLEKLKSSSCSSTSTRCRARSRT